ncbi:Transcriptional repressor IclR [Achromobacter animicus]|uniref:Transcriptional repressor IclR n=1 Tax=Achromobacter animicus TaxID=1389935 RepID=A0A6S7ALC9_9BURK|nr:IclR family transcriptional regulator [Achromobacter animicus]CAB3737569.1 Transcriptional repressor IclR [Achromobacter animicus]
MAGVLERALAVMEHLSSRPEGVPLASLAQQLEIPQSAAHRLLTDLCRCGYVRQIRDHGDYALTARVASIGLSYLAATGIVDIAQPLVDRLADISGELVRLAIVDNEERLTWVAKAQGARHGLRYDPEMGSEARLSCSASGHAWMLTMTDERALDLVSRQGFGSPEEYGPNAPTTIAALTKMLQAGRKRGYAMINEVFAPGMTAMAAPVQRKGEAAIGVLSIAGPAMRLTEARMEALGPDLLAAAQELALASLASPMFRTRFPMQGRNSGDEASAD